MNVEPCAPVATKMRAGLRGLRIVAITLLAMASFAACGETGEVDNDVLGVSVITSPLGRAHIAIAGSNVGVRLPDLSSDTMVGLQRDGNVIATQSLSAGAEATLSADDPGLYELVAIEEGEATQVGDAELAPSTSITRLTVVRIGE